MYTHTHTHTHTYIYIYTHTHTICWWALRLIGDGTFGWLRLGCILSQDASQPLTWFQPALSALPRKKTSESVLLISRVQIFHSHFVSSTNPPTNQRDLSFRCWTPACVAWTIHSPVRSFTHVIPFFIWVSSQGHRSSYDWFSSFPTQLFVYLNYSLGCTGVFLPVSS